MQALYDLGKRLQDISDDQLGNLPYPDLLDAIHMAKKISKGNARKRQTQYIAKLLRSLDLSPIEQLLDRMNASSRAHNQAFHQLEQWRERLIEDDKEVFTEIFSNLPNIDRQQLRHLATKARDERKADAQQPVNFRKLFQYLKNEMDDH
jgi:ribosome-associated protein